MMKSKLKHKNVVKKQAWFIHLFPTFISSFPHHKKIFLYAGKYTLYIVICIFLLLNIFLSQFISPLYFQMMNENQKIFVYYLKSIRSLPQFSSELLRLKNTYGNELQNDVYSKEIEEKRMIQKYEQILDKNMYSRDILYSLFFLYDQTGDKKVAQEYLNRAKTIDPSLK